MAHMTKRGRCSYSESKRRTFVL